MRVIKFRAWNQGKTRGRWLSPNEFILRSDGRIGYWNYNDDDWEELPEYNTILSQFTGLTDKNGKDVFEGDIVKFTTHDHSGIVTYSAPSFIAKTPFTDNLVFNKLGIFSLQGYEFEVIGNIYENRNLLEA